MVAVLRSKSPTRTGNENGEDDKIALHHHGNAENITTRSRNHVSSEAYGGIVDTEKDGIHTSKIKSGVTSKKWSRTAILTLGQIVSIFLACGGAAQATLHLECHLSAPTFSTGLVYFLLSFLLIPLAYVRRRSSGANQQHHRLSSKNKEGSGFVYGTTVNDTVYTEEKFDTDDEGDGLSAPRASDCKYSLCGVIPLHAPVWAYVLLALLDVEANYVSVLAFKYTTLISVNVFDALTIPTAMILSKLFLRRSYVWVHVLGATICMGGIVLNVWSDYASDQEESSSAGGDQGGNAQEDQEYPHKFWGDMLAISGGLLWGLNNVLHELSIKSYGGPIENLGMRGLFGTLISIAQVAIFERDDLMAMFDTTTTSTCGTGEGILLLLAYVFSLALIYLGGAYFLLVSESALYNLSLLTSDFFTVVFSVVAEHIVPPPLFFVALVWIVGGVVLYETGPSPIADSDETYHGQDEEENNGLENSCAGQELQQLDEEIVEVTPLGLASHAEFS